MQFPITGASPEVLRHHGALHSPLYGCRGDRSRVMQCDCGGCLAIVCGECGIAVFVAVEPGRPFCEHARWLLEPPADESLS